MNENEIKYKVIDIKNIKTNVSHLTKSISNSIIVVELLKLTFDQDFF